MHGEKLKYIIRGQCTIWPCVLACLWVALSALYFQYFISSIFLFLFPVFSILTPSTPQTRILQVLSFSFSTTTSTGPLVFHSHLLNPMPRTSIAIYNFEQVGCRLFFFRPMLSHLTSLTPAFCVCPLINAWHSSSPNGAHKEKLRPANCPSCPPSSFHLEGFIQQDRGTRNPTCISPLF